MRCLTAAAFVLACGPATEGEAPSPVEAAPPPVSASAQARSPAGGSSVPSAEEVEEVVAAVRELGAMEGVRTVDVWRGGERIASETFRGADRGPWNVKSASKSLLSAMVGIAIERGILQGLEQPVAELLPEAFADAGGEESKRAIELRHLLAMQPGLASTSGEHYGAWVSSRDWTVAALARPLVAPPGTTFDYSTGSSHLVSAILARASGTTTRAFAERHLLEPLGVTVDGWDRSPEGVHLGGNNVLLTPDELARFGRLYLQGGEWEGRQLVPRDWVETSTRRHAVGWPDRYGAYGYLWWLPPGRPGAFLAVGYGGQLLYVDPATATVVVVTATLQSKGEEWDRAALALIRRRILGGD